MYHRPHRRHQKVDTNGVIDKIKSEMFCGGTEDLQIDHVLDIAASIRGQVSQFPTHDINSSAGKSTLELFKWK